MGFMLFLYSSPLVGEGRVGGQSSQYLIKRRPNPFAYPVIQWFPWICLLG